MTFAELVRDFWAHLHADDAKLRDNLGDDDFDATLRELGIDAAELASPTPADEPEEISLEEIPPDDSDLVAHETYGSPA